VTRPSRLLDTGVVIMLQRIGHLDRLAELAKVFDLSVVEEVFDELTRPRNGKHAELAKAAQLALAAVSKVSLDVGSVAAAALPKLLGQPREISRQDAVSMAWILYEGTSHTFVTRDALCAYRALEELQGRRVLGVFAFLREAVEAGALTRMAVQQIAEAAVSTNGVRERLPSWWTTW